MKKKRKPLTITAALDRFVLQLEADGRSLHTIGQYRRHIRLLARWARSARRTWRGSSRRAPPERAPMAARRRKPR